MPAPGPSLRILGQGAGSEETIRVAWSYSTGKEWDHVHRHWI